MIFADRMSAGIQILEPWYCSVDRYRVNLTTMDYDHFLVKVGIFGRYQKVCFALLFVAYIPGALLNFNIVFQAAIPDHVCLNPNAEVCTSFFILLSIHYIMHARTLTHCWIFQYYSRLLCKYWMFFHWI